MWRLMREVEEEIGSAEKVLGVEVMDDIGTGRSATEVVDGLPLIRKWRQLVLDATKELGLVLDPEGENV